jgi:ABC-type branched-subunit amino acid transport system permease subunit
MTRPARREVVTLLGYCGVGAVVLGVLARSGLFFPPTLWATVGGAVLGAWVGLAIYRLRSDSFI